MTTAAIIQMNVIAQHLAGPPAAPISFAATTGAVFLKASAATASGTAAMTKTTAVGLHERAWYRTLLGRQSNLWT